MQNTSFHKRSRYQSFHIRNCKFNHLMWCDDVLITDEARSFTRITSSANASSGPYYFGIMLYFFVMMQNGEPRRASASSSGKLRRAAVRAQLVVELVRARLDRHARAVEALREQDPLAAQPVVRARKLQLLPASPSECGAERVTGTVSR